MFFAYVITEGAQIINFDLKLKSTFIPKMFGEVLKAKIRQYLSCVTDLCCCCA